MFKQNGEKVPCNITSHKYCTPIWQQCLCPAEGRLGDVEGLVGVCDSVVDACNLCPLAIIHLQSSSTSALNSLSLALFDGD